MSGLSRREFLGVAGGAVTVAAGVPWLLTGSHEVGKTLTSSARLPVPFALAGRVPHVLRPLRRDPRADHYRIVQRRARQQILPGYSTEILGYNGTFPGPTLAVRRNRTAVVTHRNEIDVPTVVHLHGGHTPHDSDGYPTDYLYPIGLPASQPAGDPHAAVASGERDYTYPNRQRAATLWYHDHRMEFTGASVWRGLAGFHVIADDDEAELGLPSGDHDLPLMLSDRAFDEHGQFRYPAIDPTMRSPGVTGGYTQGVQGDVILVNGVPWPRFDVAAARYRLRWLNGSNARVYRLRIDSPHRQAPGFVQIGSDGGLLGAAQELDAIPIAPSERFDTILDLTGYRPGEVVDVLNDLGSGTTVPVLRFRVTHTPTQDSSRLPDRLSDFETLDPTKAVRRRDIDLRRLQMPGSRSEEMYGWLINGRPFDPARTDAAVRLGELELWRITTDFNHPFHIHLNQFQVLSRNGDEPAVTDRGWKDTINLDATGSAELLIRFTDYTGRFLFHCHNLEHEDMAMMANFAAT